jgi:hypothetical protein
MYALLDVFIIDNVTYFVYIAATTRFIVHRKLVAKINVGIFCYHDWNVCCYKLMPQA